MICAMCLTKIISPAEFCSIECYKEFKDQGGIE